MLAFQHVPAHTTELREMDVPEPGPGEVLVKVGAAGAPAARRRGRRARLRLARFDTAAGRRSRLGRRLARARRPRRQYAPAHGRDSADDPARDAPRDPVLEHSGRAGRSGRARPGGADQSARGVFWPRGRQGRLGPARARPAGRARSRDPAPATGTQRCCCSDAPTIVSNRCLCRLLSASRAGFTISHPSQPGASRAIRSAPDQDVRSWGSPSILPTLIDVRASMCDRRVPPCLGGLLAARVPKRPKTLAAGVELLHRVRLCLEDGCGRLRVRRAFDEDPADRLPTSGERPCLTLILRFARCADVMVMSRSRIWG